jgi:hypothetical protein
MGDPNIFSKYAFWIRKLCRLCRGLNNGKIDDISETFSEYFNGAVGANGMAVGLTPSVTSRLFLIYIIL